MEIRKLNDSVKEPEDSRIVCTLRGLHGYKEILKKINQYCVELGTPYHAIITYDLERETVICDVVEISPNGNKCRMHDVPIDQCVPLLKWATHKNRKEYRKKVFTEAAEIAAKIDGEQYNVSSTASDEMFDYLMSVKIADKYAYYYHSIKANSWVSRNENKWTDTLTGERYSNSEIFCRKGGN